MEKLSEKYEQAVKTLNKFDAFLSNVENDVKTASNINELKNDLKHDFSSTNMKQLAEESSEDESTVDMLANLAEEAVTAVEKEEKRLNNVVRRTVSAIVSPIVSMQKTINELQASPYEKLMQFVPGQGKMALKMGDSMLKSMGMDLRSIIDKYGSSASLVVFDSLKQTVFKVTPQVQYELAKKGYTDIAFSAMNSLDAREMIKAANLQKLQNTLFNKLTKHFTKKVEVTREEVERDFNDPSKVKLVKIKEKATAIDFKKIGMALGILLGVAAVYGVVDSLLNAIISRGKVKTSRSYETMLEELFETNLNEGFADFIRNLVNAPFKLIQKVTLKLVNLIRTLIKKMKKLLYKVTSFSVSIALILFLPILAFTLIVFGGIGLKFLNKI